MTTFLCCLHASPAIVTADTADGAREAFLDDLESGGIHINGGDATDVLVYALHAIDAQRLGRGVFEVDYAIRKGATS